jgi:tetratricopeptide (TPR) repeat protein
MRPAPEGKGVPSWVRRVLLRGLSVAPAARFSAMAALLDALDDDPAARRRKWLAGAVAIGLAAALALVVNRVGTRARTLCAGGAARLAGIWEPSGVSSPRKEAVRAAFARTDRAYATQAFERASQSLDAYADRWIAMDRDACEATRVRAEQPAAVSALRTSCLEDRRASLRALTDVFTLANAGVVQNAVSAVDGLPPLESCADLPALRADARAADPVLQQRLEPLRERYAHVQALAISGQCAQAVKEGEPLLADLRAGGYRPLLAETLLISGRLGDSCVDPRTAIARSREGYEVAIAAHLDRLAARAAAQIPTIASNRLGDDELAQEWLGIARASFDRAGRDDQVLGSLLASEAYLASARGDTGRGVALTCEAYEVTRRAFGPDHNLTLMSIGNVGNALAAAGHLEEAVAEDRRAAEEVGRVLGPMHPSIGLFVYNTCEALNLLGRFAEARAECQRALDVWVQAGTDEGITNYGQTGLGIALVGLGRGEEAIAPLEIALRSRVAMNVSPRLDAETRFALASALWSRPSARARARDLAREARADAARDGTPDDAKMLARIDAWLANPGANAVK